TWSLKDAHDEPLSMVRLFDVAGASGGGGGSGGSSSTSLIASGDEGGGLKIWDARVKKQVMSYKKHTDYISDAALHERERALVVTSGDGTLSVHDLRAGAYKFRARSEDDADDELLSVAILKSGKKVVAGCQSGVLGLYSWGYFADCSDRFPGHPESVDALAVFDEDTLITGSFDGVVRVVNVLPNKLIGVVGSHEDFPIERLAISADKRVLASTSHDNTIRLWDLAMLHDDGEDEEEEEENEEGSDQGEEAGRLGASKRAASAEDMSESGSEGDEDGSEEWEEADEEEVLLTESKPEGMSPASAVSSKRTRRRGSMVGASEKGRRESEGVKSGSTEDEQTGSLRGSIYPGTGGGMVQGSDVQGPGGSSGHSEGGSSKQSAGLNKGKPLKEKKQQRSEGPSEEDSDQDSDSSDSDSDGRKGKKRKQKREKTRWPQQQKSRKTGKEGGNFFADLL
ncbi:WD40-repeat-containing domain protein, partial [Dunaliella salina]